MSLDDGGVKSGKATKQFCENWKREQKDDELFFGEEKKAYEETDNARYYKCTQEQYNGNWKCPNSTKEKEIDCDYVCDDYNPPDCEDGSDEMRFNDGGMEDGNATKKFCEDWKITEADDLETQNKLEEAEKLKAEEAAAAAAAAAAAEAATDTVEVTGPAASYSVGLDECINSDIDWKFDNIKAADTVLYKIPKNEEEGLPKYYPKNTIQNNSEVYYLNFDNRKSESSKITMTNFKSVLDSMTLGFYINGSTSDSATSFSDILKITTDDKIIKMSYNGGGGGTGTLSFEDGGNKSLAKFDMFDIGEENDLKKKQVEKNWIVLKLYIEFENGTRTMKLAVNHNNESEKIYSFAETEVNELNIKKIEFSNFKGYIGRIMLWNTRINRHLLCSHYQCYRKYADCSFSIKDTKNGKNYSKWLTWDASTGADECIKHCWNESKETCSLKDCQKLCLTCNDNKNPMKDQQERHIYCPWNKELLPQLNVPKKITSLKEGETNDTSVVLQWSAENPNTGISHYVLEIKESFTNQNYKLILLHNDNTGVTGNKEYKISNLKKDTSYDIYLTAKNNIGIGEKSDKLTIKTSGTQNSISDMYNDINSRNYNYVMNCNNYTDHILDTLDIDNINILKNLSI